MPKTQTCTIGQIIQEARQTRKMSQEELGGKVFNVQQMISAWERDVRIPGIEDRIALADKLNIPVTDLFPEMQETLSSNKALDFDSVLIVPEYNEELQANVLPNEIAVWRALHIALPWIEPEDFRHLIELNDQRMEEELWQQHHAEDKDM